MEAVRDKLDECLPAAPSFPDLEEELGELRERLEREGFPGRFGFGFGSPFDFDFEFDFDPEEVPEEGTSF